MMVADSMPKMKLKIKFPSKKIEGEERSKSCVDESKSSVYHSQNNSKLADSVGVRVRQPTQSSSKRGPEMVDYHQEKRQKIDHRIKQQCGRILRTLLSNRDSFGFTEPVDPDKLGVPDYFSIITKPMDLGTVSAKLRGDKYFCVEEFAADVRLTFSNAMTYNPPCNLFNRAAKRLDTLFNSEFKSLETKLKRDNVNVRESCPRKYFVHVSSFPKASMSVEEKRKLGKDLVEAMKGKMTENLRTFLQKLGVISDKGMTGSEIDGLEDDTLLVLQRLVKGSLDARAPKEEPAKIMPSGKCLPGKVLHKGTVSGNRSSCGSVKIISSLSLVTSKCHSCGSLRCQCSVQNDNINVTSIERSSRQEHGVSKMEHEEKSKITSNSRKSDPESDGSACVLDEGNMCSSPQGLTLGTSVADVWTPGIDVHLSPKKALRAAMLKSRFADTIVKAKQKTLLENGDRVDPVKLQQEKGRLERQQREEKTRIEAQIRAAEDAAILRAHEELKMRRERDREAARIALQKMEKTVEIDENLKFLKELEMFSRSMSSGNLFDGTDKSDVLSGASESDYLGSPLERLGLFIKEDDEDEEDEMILHGDGEEGEILS